MRAASIHAKLFKRLSLGTVAIAVIAASVVYAIELRKMDRAFLALALEEAGLFSARVAPLMAAADDAGVEAALAAFMAERRHVPKGHFVVAEIYDAGRRKVADSATPAGETIEPLLDASPHRFPADASPVYARFDMDGRHFLQAVLQMTDAGGTHFGFMESVYEISDQTFREIRSEVVTSVALAVLAVVLISALLYPLILSLNRDLIKLSVDLVHANIDLLEVLGGAIAKRDSDTSAHNFRVTLYAVRLAEAIGLPAHIIRGLIKGAFLHDVGKIAIRDAILLKPGRLNDAEFEEMKTHVQHGVDVVKRSRWLEDAADVVMFHHEKWDGTGYPLQLAGEGIPVKARIFAIADVFDALTSRRPYKEPMDFDRAMDIMANGRGSHFDPQLFDTFASMARSLHERYGGADGERTSAVEDDVQRLTKHYFADTV